MVLRASALAAFLASLVGCSSSASKSPAYASCNDELPAPIHTEADGAPFQIRAYRGTFYWTPTSTELSPTILALAPGGEPKPVLSLPDGIGFFLVDGDGLFVEDGKAVLWRAPLDGSSPPVKLFDPAVSGYAGYALAKDATALYLAHPGTGLGAPTDPMTGVTIVECPLDGSGSRVLADFDVPSVGDGETLFDDGDALIGGAGGSIFRVAKGDGRVLAHASLNPNVELVMPAVTPARGFYALLEANEELGELDVNGNVAQLWPPDAPAFQPAYVATATDGTAYFSGATVARHGDGTTYGGMAYVTARPGEAPAITTCTPAGGMYVTALLTDDAGTFAVLEASPGESWEIVPMPR